MGEPGDCPECGQPGFLEGIRPTLRRQYQSCRSCGTRWIYDINDDLVIDITTDEAVVQLGD